MNTPPSFKLVICGEGFVGKTTWVKRFFHQPPDPGYIRGTGGVEVYPLRLLTSRGPILFNIWDTAGQEKFGGLRDGWYLQADSAIIMFDVTSRMAYRRVPDWHRDIVRVCGTIPTVLTGTKVDVSVDERKVKPKHIVFHRRKGLQYCEMSSLCNFNVEKPLLILARHLMGDPELTFLESPRLPPPDRPIDLTLAAQYVEQMEQLSRNGMPEDQHDDQDDEL